MDANTKQQPQDGHEYFAGLLLLFFPPATSVLPPRVALIPFPIHTDIFLMLARFLLPFCRKVRVLYPIGNIAGATLAHLALIPQ